MRTEQHARGARYISQPLRCVSGRAGGSALWAREGRGVTDPYGDLTVCKPVPKNGRFGPKLGRRKFDHDEAEQRYEAGESTVELAAAYGVSSAAVQAMLRRRGVKLRKHWEVTRNLERANARKKARTHCKRGHAYTPENTYVGPHGRQCRACTRIVTNAARARNAERGLTRHGEKRKWPPKTTPVKVLVACAGCGNERLMWALPKGRQRWCSSCRMIQAVGTGDHRICPCGRAFYAQKRSNGKLAQFCSIECRVTTGGYKDMGKKLSLERGGDGNPSYKHGRRIGIQIPGWKLNNKGEKKCRNCGANGRGENGRLELHHAIPRSKARHVKADLRNGVPLCQVCHTGWHGKRVAIYRDIFTEEEWAFISSVKLTGENIGAWLDKHYPARPLEAAA